MWTRVDVCGCYVMSENKEHTKLTQIAKSAGPSHFPESSLRSQYHSESPHPIPPPTTFIIDPTNMSAALKEYLAAEHLVFG